MSDSVINNPKPDTKANHLEVLCGKGDDPNIQTAKAILSPGLSSAIVAGQWSKNYGGTEFHLIGAVKALEAAAQLVNNGDLSEVEARLLAQATALDALFSEMSRRAANNIAEYPDAFDRYMKLALKAQNQCRMTLETLGNIKNPTVVYTKQANFAAGHQQVNNGLTPLAHATENENPPSKLLE